MLNKTRTSNQVCKWTDAGTLQEPEIKQTCLMSGLLSRDEAVLRVFVFTASLYHGINKMNRSSLSVSGWQWA